MFLKGRPWARATIALVTLSLLAHRAGFAADEPQDSLAQYYGFGKLELYKLQQRSTNLLAADLNNDGRTDLILIDNSNSRLDLLQQKARPEAASKSPPSGKINSIENDKRFDHKKIPVDREVASLSIGDFNGDGRKDLVYFAAPDQLTIVYQSAAGDWTTRKRVRLPDVQAAQWNLAAGDLNRDGKDDIAVLGKHDIYLLYQQPAGELAPPARLMNTGENLGLAQIADLDGDGRNDLCYLSASDADRPLCVRLQSADARLGPELRCELPKYRGVTVAEVDGKPGSEILAIELQTGRVKIHQLQQPDVKPGEVAGQLIQYGFGQGSGKSRDLATGDVDGDGLVDVVVTDPESAQVIVFLQHKGAGLDLGNTFPGLMGAEQVRLGDVDGDSKIDVVVLSTREKTIGISKMENGRLTFPHGLPLEKEPVVFDLVDLNGDNRPEIVYVGKERGSSSAKFALAALTRTATGEWRSFKFSDHDSIPIAPKGSNLERLTALDANHDGRPDFLIFSAGSDRPPMFLLSNPQGVPVELPTSEGGFGLGNVSAGGLFLGELDQPVILVAQNNFARNVAVNDKNHWQVLDQYNAAEAEAKIVGAATIDLDGEPGREIVLVDQGVKKLRVLRKEGTVFRPWREVDTGAFPYRSTHVADLNGDGREDLLLFGTGKFGVLYAGRSDPRLKTLATYESKLEKVRFMDLVAGDLNSDGQTDIAVIDTQSQMIDILNYTAAAGLRHAMHFKVFEAKGVVSEERAGNEPREAVIADVTGDGKPDLVLLSQDRVLIYPQDDGKDDGEATARGDRAGPAR